MRGVNEELMPIVRMTYPAEAASNDISQAPVGTFLFHSWILLGGFLPIDRHHLRLTSVEPGRGFIEESVSWNQKYWRHERVIEPVTGGCVLTDHLTFRPRFTLMGFLITRIIRRLFFHRHAQLRKKYGELKGVR